MTGGAVWSMDASVLVEMFQYVRPAEADCLADLEVGNATNPHPRVERANADLKAGRGLCLA